MAYCPACRSEYEEGIPRCSDCGGELRSGAMPSTGPVEGWKCVMRVGLEQNAQIIQGLLTSAGLECEVINKTVVEFPVPALDPRARIEIWVPEHQAAEATAVLEEARKEAAPCPSCGHMSAAEEAVCEYCGVAAT